MAKRTPSATLRPSKADAPKRHDLQKQDVSANCEEMKLNSEPTRAADAVRKRGGSARHRPDPRKTNLGASSTSGSCAGGVAMRAVIRATPTSDMSGGSSSAQICGERV